MSSHHPVQSLPGIAEMGRHAKPSSRAVPIGLMMGGAFVLATGPMQLALLAVICVVLLAAVIRPGAGPDLLPCEPS